MISDVTICVLPWVMITAGIIRLTYYPGKGYVFLDNEGFEATH